MPIRSIGVLTSGGDSPGMNPFIRAVVRAGLFHDLIPENIPWAAVEGRTAAYENPRNGTIGWEMLESGIAAKEFHSSLPHEILIEDDHIKSITVKGVTYTGVKFSFKSASPK